MAWADAHHGRMGVWPRKETGRIADAPSETWMGVEMALSKGRRGLPGGSSLVRVLAEHRGLRNKGALPPLSQEVILSWADAHFARTGRWPVVMSGPIHGIQGETWQRVEESLARGYRGLPPGSSLARLLTEYRGVRNVNAPPRLTPELILAWADAHHARTGRWPLKESGPIGGAPGETWMAVENGFRKGTRGLPGGSSLSRFLKQHGRV